MKSQKPLLFFLALTTALAAPLNLLPRHESRILSRQQQNQNITQPVTFQTVETSQTQVGTITETCQVTLTPITDSSGAQSIRQDKTCTYDVLPAGESPPPPPPASSSGDNGQATTSTSASAGTTTTSSDTSTSTSTDTNTTSSSASVTDSAASSSSSSSSSSSDTSTTTPAADPNSSAQTTGAAASTSPSATPSDSPAATPILSTQSDGSVTTVNPSAAEAQTSATQEEVPGRKLEVLPIGLGVFAGISVIALIVVGLVTYERTKYRRAFRQRKLAEAGANMGYGGMAERT